MKLLNLFMNKKPLKGEILVVSKCMLSVIRPDFVVVKEERILHIAFLTEAGFLQRRIIR
jgi:hypothetical protein